MNTSNFLKTAALGLAFVTASASAEFIDGNELHRRLHSAEGFDQIYAMGYVAGVADGGFTVTHCAPGEVKLGQVMDIVKAHLIKHPERRHWSGDVLVNQALRLIWPCPERAPRGRGT